ncbi:MAG: type II toxin-antitoxin system VapC family toxin [Thermoproteota archaeon]
MIFDTSLILRILSNRELLDALNVSEEVRITSVTAYELLRGAMYINITSRRDRELNVILSLISELNIIPFTSEDAKIASYIWAKLKEAGKVVSDADILIASICTSNNEKLLTLDEDYEKIKSVYEKLEVNVLKET